MDRSDRLTKWVGVLIVALLIEIGLRECIRVFVDAHFEVDDINDIEVAADFANSDKEVDHE